MKKGHHSLNAKTTANGIARALDYARSNRKQRVLGGSMIRAGKICCGCLGPLLLPHTTGIKYCELCQLPTTHGVYMSFMHRNGWHCQFLEWDLKTPLPRQVRYRDSGKIWETARRGHGLPYETSRSALDRAIKTGRGMILLHLTKEQYLALKVTGK
jgi:hypothetical protein